jgi:hypothetical protein
VVGVGGAGRFAAAGWGVYRCGNAQAEQVSPSHDEVGVGEPRTGYCRQCGDPGGCRAIGCTACASCAPLSLRCGDVEGLQKVSTPAISDHPRDGGLHEGQPVLHELRWQVACRFRPFLFVAGVVVNALPCSKQAWSGGAGEWFT